MTSDVKSTRGMLDEQAGRPQPGRSAARIGMGFALFNLFLAASAGAMLRLAFVVELDWFEFTNVLHAHSHTAMLGWATIALFSLFHLRFLSADSQRRRTYIWIFGLMEVTVIAMALSFSIQGYAAWSIISSSAFVILIYGFAIRFLQDLKAGGRMGFAVRLVRTAISFLILSTIILWAVGPVIALDLRFSRIFYLLIQAFLHFMINGWFVFAALALVFDLFNQARIEINGKKFRYFYNLLFASTFLTYALAVAWSDPEWWVFGINSLGVVIQCIALIWFGRIIWPLISRLRSHLSPTAAQLIFTGLIAFALKILIQTCVALPFLATIAYTIRYFVIGFLHLILLGFITMTIFGILCKDKELESAQGLVRMGLGVFGVGFAVTELLLFTQGIMAWGTLGLIPAYYVLVFIFAILMACGVLCLLLAFVRTHYNS